MKKAFAFPVICLCASFTTPTWAEGWDFKTGLNLGSRTLAFDQHFDQGPLSVPGFSTQPAKRTANYTQTFRSADLTATASRSNFYVTVNYETSLDAENGVVQTTISDPTGSSSSDYAFDFTRHDYAINFGWNALGNFSVFTGYKYGETDSSRNAVFGIVGSPNGKVDSTFKESGPFIGVSNNWVYEAGILTLSTAYAYMTGNYDESGNEIIFAQALSPTHVKAVVQNALRYDGHTDGFSANLSWNVVTTEHFAYYFGARWQHYEFSANSNITWTFYDVDTSVPSMIVIPLHGSGQVHNSETITGLYAGINYLF